jgi:hypothetical protein
MNNEFYELSKCSAQSGTRRAALKNFSSGLAGISLAGLLALSCSAANPNVIASTVFDPAGDAVFPTELYGAPVPPYLDMVSASVSYSYSRGVFHFEIQMSAPIPDNPSPDFAADVNHMGPAFGILTDSKSAGVFKFFGQTDTYRFNFIVGALYSFADSGAGLPLGWSGLFIDVSTFIPVAIPLQIKGDTLIFEMSADSLGAPASFQWAIGCEVDPVPIPEEKHKVVLMVDYLPDHGYANWPAQ